MDEIIIEDKKYISSKRAAKATGYAKDYVGQLCREGRVPARLVGRNWYVLETAIQDHRFGSQDASESDSATKEEETKSNEWESPKYEALSTNEFPQIQDSWKEWFERIADTAASVMPSAPIMQESGADAETEEAEKVEDVTKEEEEKDVQVPIRAIHHQRYQAPPDELLPRRFDERVGNERVAYANVVEDLAGTTSKRLEASVIPIAKVIAIIVAVTSVALAVLGSGLFDKYIISFRQVEILSGITTINK